MLPRMQRMMQPRRDGEILRVSYHLDDGRWLNFTTLAPRFDSIWRSRFLLAFSVMALVVTVLSVWAVRRSTAPLALKNVKEITEIKVNNGLSVVC